MCVVLSPPSKPSSSQTLVDAEAILATLTIGSLQIDSSSDSSPSVSGENSTPDKKLGRMEKEKRINSSLKYFNYGEQEGGPDVL